MKINGYIWREDIVDKLWWKHNVDIEEVEEVMVRLISAPNPETYEEDLHFLKGSALSLGFSAFSDLCQIGEKAAANGQADSINLEKIFEVYAESKTEFLNKPLDSAAA